MRLFSHDADEWEQTTTVASIHLSSSSSTQFFRAHSMALIENNGSKATVEWFGFRLYFLLQYDTFLGATRPTGWYCFQCRTLWFGCCLYAVMPLTSSNIIFRIIGNLTTAWLSCSCNVLPCLFVFCLRVMNFKWRKKKMFWYLKRLWNFFIPWQLNITATSVKGSTVWRCTG